MSEGVLWHGITAQHKTKKLGTTVVVDDVTGPIRAKAACKTAMVSPEAMSVNITLVE